MESRLTVKLDKKVIESVKLYAQNHSRSVSELVEEYFKKLVVKNDKEKHFSPLVEELSGVISESDLKKTDYVAYLEKKYE
jgi:hypothetical protein